MYPKKAPSIRVGKNIPPAAPEPKQSGVRINFNKNIITIDEIVTYASLKHRLRYFLSLI